MLSSLLGMESRWSRAQRKARFCKGKGMSEALTRTLRLSCCSCCSVAFFFCIKLLRNLLRLSNSSSAPSISFSFTGSLSHHLETNALLSLIGGYSFSVPLPERKCERRGKREREDTVQGKKEWGRLGKETKVSNAMFALVFLFYFSFVFFRCVCCCSCVWPRSLG